MSSNTRLSVSSLYYIYFLSGPKIPMISLKYRLARRVQSGFVFCLLLGSNEIKEGS